MWHGPARRPSGRTRCSSSRESRERWNCFSGPGRRSSSLSVRRRGMCSRCFSVDRGRLQTATRRAGPGGRGHPAGVRVRPHGHGQEAAPAEIEALRQFLTREGTCLILGPPRGRRLGGSEHTRYGVPSPRRPVGAPPATLRTVHAVPDARPRVPVENATVRARIRDNQLAPLSVARDVDTKVAPGGYHLQLPRLTCRTMR